MSRFLVSLFVSLLLLAVAAAQIAPQNSVQILYPPVTIPQNGSVSITVQWETNYVGTANLHFDLSDASAKYAFGGGTFTVVTGPGSGTADLTAAILSNLNLGDQYQLHAYLTPTNYSVAFNMSNDWMYAWANTYPIAVVSLTQTVTNSMTLLYPPATIPPMGWVAFDVAYSTNLPNYTMLHIDMSDTSSGWNWDGGNSIMVPSPGSGVVQFNISLSNVGQPLVVGHSIDINMYMTAGSDNIAFGTGNDWLHKNYSNTGTSAIVAAATSFWNNVQIVNPPATVPTSGTFTVQVSYATNVTGQVILHCDLNDASAKYAYDGGYSMYVTGPGTGVVTMTINISAQVTAALNTSHAFQLHTYLLDEATSQATGVYNDWENAMGGNYYPTYATSSYATGIPYGDYITLVNPPAWIPNNGVLELTVAWESSALNSVDLRIDLSDDSQLYAWGGGASVTVPSPGAGIATLQISLVNGTTGLLNQFDIWQFHVYTVSAINMNAHPTDYWSYPNAEMYYPVVVSNQPITNYAAIINPPSVIPQVGSISVDLYYVSNLLNQTVIHLDVNDLSAGWNWDAGTSVTVPSPSAGTVHLTLNFPASLNLTVGHNLVLQYYLTSIWNSTNNPGNDWKTFQFEDRVGVQVAPIGQLVNSITPVNAPAQIPNSGNFTIQFSYSTNVTGLVDLYVDVLDVTQSYTPVGSAKVLVEGPSQGTVVFTVVLNQVSNTSDYVLLHAYLGPNAIPWIWPLTDTYLGVQLVLPSSLKPFIYSDSLSFYRPPASIPTSGTIDVVMLWSSSAATSTVLHCDLSDVSQKYAFDGGYTTVVPSPGSGSVICSIPITSVLSPSDTYQLHGYSVSAANHTLYSANEWQYTNFDVYSPVVVSNTPVTNFVQLQSPPTTIPTTGTVTYDLVYTSNFASQTVLHLDLNDVSNKWNWITGNQVIVQSPGSGVVSITLTFTAAMAIQVGDVLNLKAYMTSIANDTAHPGLDWEYSGYDNYNTVYAAPINTFANSLSPLYTPTAIPNTGSFSATYQYSTNYSGLVDLHLDLSDLSWNYISGSPTAQVTGPGQGTYTFNLNVTSASVTALTVGQSYYLHAYMAAAADGLEYGTGQDWNHVRGDSVITVPAATLQSIGSSNLNFSIVFFQNPGTIPSSGTVELVVEWSSPAQIASVLHIDLSDVSANYSWGGGASLTVPSPGRGFTTLVIPIVGTLNAGDVWQAHAYITSLANATADPGNDWKHSAIDLYVPVVVSNAPLTNYMSILNPPSTIPTVGQLMLELFYISACANSTNLHLDLSDVTGGWIYEAGSMVTVPTPGTGTVTLSITTTAAMAMVIGHQFDLHIYSTCAINASIGGGNDWMNTSYNNVATTVNVALPGTFINSLRPVNAPYFIPNSGNFTVQYAWSCNITGDMNFHVDLSDLTLGWLYEGGATVQATCPGSGVAPFTIALPATIKTGDLYNLHAYMAPTSSGLLHGTNTDWSYSLYDGFTVVQAILAGSVVSNSLTFVNPVAIIPQSGNFYVTLAWTSNLPTMSNIHIDLSDTTNNAWTFEVGSLTQVTSPGSGQIVVLLTVPASLNLQTGDTYQLHAYMASIANATLYGNSTDWSHSAVDAFSPVTVYGGALPNQMTIVNAPTTIANTGQETFQLIWSSSTSDLLNLHCDLSDVTQLYAYDGGAYQQVQGPGSGLVYMTVVLANNTGGGPLKIGDNYTLHCYMTNATTTAAVGGTGSDWRFPQFESFYPMVVATSTSFINSMSLLAVPTFVPTSGNFSVQVVWSSNIPGETNLHLDLSDVSKQFNYDGGALQVVTSPGSGIVTMTIQIAATMPVRDQYELHAYMAPSANSTSWGGTGQDWSHATFQNQWYVNATGSNATSSSTGSAGGVSSSGSVVAPTSGMSTPSAARSSSSSTAINGGSGTSNSGSSGLSGGSIAGIVIGSVVGVSILAAILFLFVCGGGRIGNKGGKLDDAQGTGSHQRHLDEPSVSNAPSNIEMGETHSSEEEHHEEQEA